MNIRVFLADDHTILRDGLRLLINSEPDMEVVGEASNGRDAVHRATRIRPDVTVMGITMPELNGIDATMQIMELMPSARILILSTHCDTLNVFRALRAGASGYVTKESEGKELISAIRTVYRGGRHLSSELSEKLIDDYIFQYGRTGVSDPLARLSRRERQILELTVEGKSSKEIGLMLCLSPKTANTYRYRLMEKLGIKDLPGLIRFGIQSGLAPLE